MLYESSPATSQMEEVGYEFADLMSYKMDGDILLLMVL